MTEADILSLRVQATRVEHVRSQMKSLQGDLMRMRQSQTSFASASRSNARAVSQSYDQMAQAARRSADAQKSAMRGVQNSVLALAGSYLSMQGMKNFGSAAFEASNDRFRQQAMMNAMSGGKGAGYMAEAGRLANRQGVDVNASREMMTGLVSSNIDPGKISSFADALTILGSGTGADDIKEFARQLRQAASTGSIQGDELKIMAERLPVLNKALEMAGLSMGKLKQMSQQGDPLGFEQFSQILITYAQSPAIRKYAQEMASTSAADFQRMKNQWQTEVLEPLGDQLGPAFVRFGNEVLPYAITGAKLFGDAMVWTLDHWKPVAIGLTGAFIYTRTANIALAASAVNASRALNGLAVTNGATGLLGLLGRGGGLLKSGLGKVGGQLGMNVLGQGMARGGAQSLSLLNTGAQGVGRVFGAQALTAGTAGLATTVVSAAAVAVGAYLATKYGLDALAKANGSDGYSDALRKDFARAGGARIDSAGNESYRGSSESAFYASRARSMAKRGGAQTGDIYAKYAGLDSRNYDAALSRANSQRPANRASTQNRVARETRDAIRGAT